MLQRADQDIGLDQAALAGAAAREAALRGPDDDVAALAQGTEVGLRRLPLEHLVVHRRRDQHRRGRGEDGERHHVVGAAHGQARDRVGSGGRDDHDVGAAGDLDVLFGQLRNGVEHVEEDGAAGEAAQREGRDEARRRVGHQHVDAGTGLGKLARQIGRFVGGDAARDPQRDVPALQHGQLRFRS